MLSTIKTTTTGIYSRTILARGSASAQSAWRRRSWRCWRAFSSFRSRSAWIAACRPVSMSFGVTYPNRAVQADLIIVIRILLNQALRVFQRQWRSLPNAFPFQRLVPALQLSVRLWIVRRGSDVRHARDANKLLEVPSDELRSVVGDDSRLRFRVFLLGSF